MAPGKGTEGIETEGAQAGTEEIGRLHAVAERNRMIQIGTEEVRVLQDRDGVSSAGPGWEVGLSETM